MREQEHGPWSSLLGDRIQVTDRGLPGVKSRDGPACYGGGVSRKEPDLKRTLALTASILCAAVLLGPATGLAQTKKGKKMTNAPRDYSNTLATLQTEMGDITIKFFYDKAPNHVKNFIDLSASGFYDGTMFHRVIPGFMIQGGDPQTKKPEDPRQPYGTGGNGKNTIKAEFNDTPHKRGIVSMARASDPNSASSQFFIVVKDSNFLDNQYSAFGEVVSGMEVADKIANVPRDAKDRPNTPVRIKKVVLSEAKS
jgi:peptidyl-prolyl cis-trans isomerase B (cyclophilin B)